MDFLKESMYLINKLGHDGVLVTSGEKPNTMTASWGGITVFWNKPIIIMPVRKTRYTYGFINETGEFSVSIPDKIKPQSMAVFGSKSGRDINKYETAGVSTADCKAVKTKIINLPGYHFECKVIYKQELNLANLRQDLKNTCYSETNPEHTLFYGEIVAAYKT